MPEVTLYTTNTCPFCHAAKRLLASLGVEYWEVNLDGDPELRQRLSHANGGWRTVPMIFVGERFVGGFEELRKMHARGELRRLLAGSSAAR
jgi:glutaredoxin 3